MDRAKLLAKITKCLALSKSPNEHEAAAALRQAQKMMELYDVSEKELGLFGYTSARVPCPIQASKKIPAYLSEVCNLIRDAFGVKPVIIREVRVSDKSFTVVYFGREDRVMMAEYAHTVVYNAMSRAWTQFLKENSYLKSARGARSSYMLGWLAGVKSKVMTFAVPVEEAAKTLELATSTFRLVQSSRSEVPFYDRIAGAGAKASEKFSIHTPMNGAELKKLN